MVNSSNCSHPITWIAAKYGSYHVTVFPIKAGRGIIDSIVLHSEEVLVGPMVHSNTVNPSKPGTIKCTSIIIMRDTCFFLLALSIIIPAVVIIIIIQ